MGGVRGVEVLWGLGNLREFLGLFTGVSGEY